MAKGVLEVVPAETVRPLSTWSELDGCVALQRETWGAKYGDVVPRTLLKVAQGIGGVLLGGYEGDRLVGFVFGLSGMRGGEPVHWSHMLAVLPEHRNRGWGRRLKEAQRAVARAQGLRWMYWTFDPLVAMNAHLNLNRLGVEAEEYVRDMYGLSTSRLHEGLGTDRLIVRWDLEASPREPRRAPPQWLRARSIGAGDPGEDPATEFPDEPWLRIEIPEDIYAVRAASRKEAVAWRLSTRRAFEAYLSRGYAVSAFYRDERARRWYYVLVANGGEDGRGS